MPPTNLPVVKYLRIAVSAMSLTACVVLIVLWVRSYKVGEVFSRSKASGVNRSITALGSSCGHVYLARVQARNVSNGIFGVHDWKLIRFSPDPSVPAYHFEFTATNKHLHVPHYLIVLIVATVGAIPWLPWRTRFSLRTLLIATTLLALMLGVVIYAAR